MLTVLTYLLPPLFGGIIGYVTNDIAIRMLFRPFGAGLGALIGCVNIFI